MLSLFCRLVAGVLGNGHLIFSYNRGRIYRCSHLLVVAIVSESGRCAPNEVNYLLLNGGSKCWGLIGQSVVTRFCLFACQLVCCNGQFGLASIALFERAGLDLNLNVVITGLSGKSDVSCCVGVNLVCTIVNLARGTACYGNGSRIYSELKIFFCKGRCSRRLYSHFSSSGVGVVAVNEFVVGRIKLLTVEQNGNSGFLT